MSLQTLYHASGHRETKIYDCQKRNDSPYCHPVYAERSDIVISNYEYCCCTCVVVRICSTEWTSSTKDVVYDRKKNADYRPATVENPNNRRRPTPITAYSVVAAAHSAHPRIPRIRIQPSKIHRSQDVDNLDDYQPRHLVRSPLPSISADSELFCGEVSSHSPSRELSYIVERSVCTSIAHHRPNQFTLRAEPNRTADVGSRDPPIERANRTQCVSLTCGRQATRGRIIGTLCLFLCKYPFYYIIIWKPVVVYRSSAPRTYKLHNGAVDSRLTRCRWRKLKRQLEDGTRTRRRQSLEADDGGLLFRIIFVARRTHLYLDKCYHSDMSHVINK